MKFLVSFAAALVLICLGVTVLILTGVYNVAATVPDTGLERIIFSAAMRNSVLSHAGRDMEQVRGEEQVRPDFENITKCASSVMALRGKSKARSARACIPVLRILPKHRAGGTALSCSGSSRMESK